MHKLVIAKQSSWTTLATMPSKIELLNRMATTITALTFMSASPFLMVILEQNKSGNWKCARTENHGLSLDEANALIATMEAGL